jgi:hypothetical protein
MYPIIEREATILRALRENKEYILPVIFDKMDIPGLESDITYLDGRGETHQYIADVFLDKFTGT